MALGELQCSGIGKDLVLAGSRSSSRRKSNHVAQAIKNLGIKNPTKKGGKGIGPNDVIVLGFDHDREEGDLSQEMSSRPLVSVESRSSFGGGARPSFSALARPSFSTARPSLDATRSNSLMAAELATKQLEAEAIAMMQSPFIPSSGSEGLSEQAPTASPLRGLAGSLGKTSEPAGLGLDAGPYPDTLPSRKSESMDISGSTSEGTFTTQGIQTPDNMSLSHSYMSQLPARSDWTTGATTPLAGRASFDTGSQMTVALKSPEQLAFEDMLGRFPQQQKSLLQDISARVGKTPVLGSAGWTSREDL
uniref:Uncharacterized protein n=1 Tax=Kalmanozyma brasiliensis (strain GHG001) TaxID=1365824 RepID=V5ERX2_KALBG